MKLKSIGLSGTILAVSLCFCFSACTNTGEKDSLSGLANEKCSNRDLGLAEYGAYVYFVGKTMKLNSDGSSQITGDNNNYNTVEMIYDLDPDGDDLHFNTQFTAPNPIVVVSCPEDSASDGYWTYYSVIDEVNDSESKIFREKIDQTGKEIFCEVHAENLQIRDGRLFFASYATGQGTISCINLNSGIKKDIYVYYFREHNIGNINLCGNWIYFVDYAADGHLCRIRTDGTGLSVISGKPIIQYAIFGHTLMYQGWESPEDGKFVLAEEEGINHLYRMDLDGSNIQTIT